MVWLFLSILFQSFSVVMAKKAGLYSSGESLWLIIWNPWYLAQILFLMAQAVTWIKTLQTMELSKAYPAMSLSLALNILFAVWLFGEQLESKHGLGGLLMVAGIALVILPSKGEGHA